MIPFISAILTFCGILVTAFGQTEFRNPITEPLNDTGISPIVFKLDSNYYLIQQENNIQEIAVYKSPILTDFRNAEREVIYKSSYLAPGSMHEIDGELYFYLSIWSAYNYKIYGMKATDRSNIMNASNWGPPEIVQMESGWNWNAFGGTILNHNGKLYFVWTSLGSGWASYDMYVAELLNATAIGSERVLLRKPSEDWECYQHSGRRFCNNRTPAFIYNNDVSYLIFTGGYTWNPDYSVSYLSIPFEKDPMDPENWEYVGGPVFRKNEEEAVYSTGDASFTTSPDGSETWMMYCGRDVPEEVEDYRTPRLEKIEWNPDGTPNFPSAHGSCHPQPVPSGQI